VNDALSSSVGEKEAERPAVMVKDAVASSVGDLVNAVSVLSSVIETEMVLVTHLKMVGLPVLERVLVLGGQFLQEVLPISFWYVSTGQRRQKRVEVLLA